MVEFLERWNAYILAGLTGAVGIMWGVKRAQLSAESRLDKIELRLGEMEKDFRLMENQVKGLDAQGRDAAIHLVRIQASLDNVLEYLADLKAEIRGKADK
jgi:hypothetical protein